MSLLDRLNPRRRQVEIHDHVAAAIATGHAYDPSRYPIVSPWGNPGDFERWVWTDIIGEDVIIGTRAVAMAIPALARGRNRMCTSGGKLPLRQLTGSTPDTVQPYWTTHTRDAGSPPAHRTVWTIDDLMFYGLSLWTRENVGTEQETRTRVNWGDWEITMDGDILVYGVPAKAGEVILFTGFHEGVLDFGKSTIEDARLLYRNVRQRISDPIPAINLHQTEGVDLTDAQIDALIERWSTKRRTSTGGVAFTGKQIEAIEMGASGDAQLLIDARNAAAVDCARIIGVHAGDVDATAPKASLNYETQAGRNQEFIDFDLDLYLAPIEARLSEDDVCPAGQRVAFDRGNFTTLTPSPTGPGIED